MYASVTELVQGALVLKGGSLARLTSELQIDSMGLSRFYLADANVLVIIGMKDQKPIVIHIADDRGRGERYIKGSNLARMVFSKLGNEHLIPHIVDYRKHSVGWMLTQQCLPGKVVDVGSLSADLLVAHFSAAISVLPIDHRFQLRPLDFPMCPKSDVFRPLLENELLRPFVFESVRRIDAWLNSVQCRAVITHGDYWFSNILFGHDALTLEPLVTGVVDWEGATLGGPVGEDALFLAVHAFAEWRGCSPMTVFCMIWDGTQGSTLERMLNIVQSRFDLSSDDLGHLCIYLWLSRLMRQIGKISQWFEKRRAEWLLQPSQSAQIWMEKYPLAQRGSLKTLEILGKTLAKY